MSGCGTAASVVVCAAAPCTAILAVRLARLEKAVANPPQRWNEGTDMTDFEAVVAAKAQKPVCKTGEILFFLHLTKTAGGTLRRALKGAMGERVRFANAPALKEIENAQLDGVEILFGHNTYGIHESLGRTPRYACFVRHPVARVVSHYYQLRNVDRSPIGDKIRESTDINDYFKRSSYRGFANMMTRVIAGHGPQSDDERLAVALENIEQRFAFVGFQEHFNQSLRRLGGMLGVRLAPKRNMNVGHYNLAEVSDRTLEAIEAANEADLALYRRCLWWFLD